MTRTLFTLVLSVALLSSYGQKNVEFIKDNFPDQKSEMKNAIREIKHGDEYYNENYAGGYKLALNHYLHAHSFNENNALLNYKLGVCFFNGSVFRMKAAQFIDRAYKLDHRVDPNIFYMLGRVHHVRSEWDKAIGYYKKHQKMMPANATPDDLSDVAKKIKECQRGKELVKKPVRVFIDNLNANGDSVNSKYAEYGAVISADESTMMFTSLRKGSTGEKVDPLFNEYYEDIYISKKVGLHWSKPKNIGHPINTNGHDAISNISADGSKLLIYLDQKGDGNLFECVLKGDEWSKPKKLHKNVCSEYHEASACYSYDGKTLYFVSDRPGGFGGNDIYKSLWNEKKERWGEAINLGPSVNSKYDEKTVFVHPDGKTMYFSSNGHANIGDYDIFKSEMENGLWGDPVNMGYPINTPDKDVFFAINASGTRGYYSSFTEDGVGEKDIYVVHFIGPEKEVILNTEDNLLANATAPIKEKVIEPTIDIIKKEVTILKGIVTDAKTKQPIESSVEVIDNDAQKVVAKFTSNSKTGKYLVSLPSGKNYGIAVKAKDYMFHSENFNIPKEASYMEVTKNVGLKKIEVGSTVVLKNIFFDFDKATLRSESEVELANLIKLLSDNDKISIEISGHTDNKGSDDYNMKLSGQRAKTVVDYLIAKGVASARLTSKGYGESKPIETNDTEEGRQMNRRTEFKITKL